MMCAADFRRIARESLKGKWGIALGTGLVASLLGGTIGSGWFSFNFKVDLENYFSYSDILLVYLIITSISNNTFSA